MNPTELAAKVHASISVLRDGREQVQAHALATSQEHVLTLQSDDQDCAGGQPEPIVEVATASELSSRLLRALFGSWPPGNSDVS